MKTESLKLENGDLQITLTFDAHDQACLNNDLIDIVEWYATGPSREKIYSCKKRMIAEHKNKLLQCDSFAFKTMTEVNAILGDDVALVDAIVKMPGYLNRKQREELEAQSVDSKSLL